MGLELSKPYQVLISDHDPGLIEWCREHLSPFTWEFRLEIDLDNPNRESVRYAFDRQEDALLFALSSGCTPS